VLGPEITVSLFGHMCPEGTVRSLEVSKIDLAFAGRLATNASPDFLGSGDVHHRYVILPRSSPGAKIKENRSLPTFEIFLCHACRIDAPRLPGQVNGCLAFVGMQVLALDADGGRIRHDFVSAGLGVTLAEEQIVDFPTGVVTIGRENGNRLSTGFCPASMNPPRHPG